MAGNKTKEDKNQHPLPYYFISFPSCWQHTLLLNTTPGKEVHDCFTPCAFCPVSHVFMIDCNNLLTSAAKIGAYD